MISSQALTEFIYSNSSTIIFQSEKATLLKAVEDFETNTYKHNLHIKQGEYLAFENKIHWQYDSTLGNRSTKGSFHSCMEAYRRYIGITDDLPPTVTKKQSNNNIRENEVAKAMFFYEIIDRILLDSISQDYFTAEEAKEAVREVMRDFPKYIDLYFSDFEREV